MPDDPAKPALTRDERSIVAHALKGYRSGSFLMAASERTGRLGPARWYDADPRAILPLTPGEGLHIPRRLARTVRQRRFAITADTDFTAVVHACADPTRDGRWINDDIASLFALLHRAGHAHSVEARLAATGAHDERQRPLVAGLYGLAIGRAFCAEAMFSRPDLGGRDASKVCLVHLVAHLRRRGFELCDVQLTNPHLEQFGVREIPRAEYLRRLEALRDQPASWDPFSPEPADAG